MYLNDLYKIADSIESGIYLFTGEEEYLMKLVIKRIREKYNDINTMVFEDNVTVDSITKYCDTIPIFSERKLAIITGSVDDEAKLVEYIKDIPDYTCIVYVVKKIDKRTSLYKSIKKIGGIYEFNKLKAYELERWIYDYTKSHSIEIESSAVAYLCILSSDLASIINNLDILISFVHPDKVIRLNDVNEFFGRAIDDNIFDFIDGIQKGNKKTAIFLKDLATSGANPLYIISMLEWQYRLLIKAKILLNSGETDIKNKLGVHQYAANKIIEMAKRNQLGFFLRGQSECLKAEQAIKSGVLKDATAIELLTAKLMGAI